jgi:membrane protein
VRRVYEKAGEDNIFFLAGAISFNVLVAVVPLLLFAVGITGIVLTDRFQDPSAVLLNLLVDNIPAIGGDIDLAETVRGQFDTILGSRKGFKLIGSALLIWFSTRLVGTLRTALREVFDIAQDRGVIGGKIFDVKVVVVGGVLFLANIGVTTVVTAVRSYGVEVLGLQGETLGTIDRMIAFALSFITIWLLFVGIYRFLPARWIPWRTALIAATFTAVFHEVLKTAFGWYATDIANYQTTYGNLVTLAVLFLWVYYEAIVFVLGGEVAQVWTMRRARRVRTHSALFGRPEGAGRGA